MAIYPYCYYIVKTLSVPTKPDLPVNLTEYPRISVVINAYQEGELVKIRIADILCSDYPKNRMRVYLVNDGADKDTSMAASEIVEKLQNTEFHIIETKKRLGKTACQNMMLVNTPDEIVVFTDADITTKTDALSRLVSVLQDKEIGAACADMIPVGSDASVVGSENRYRSIYGKMCEYDTLVDSTYNFNGPLIAMKKTAVPYIQETTGADDANLALACITNGYRAVYVPEAIAYELQPSSIHSQYKQKIRRADGLIHSTLLFASEYHESRKKFWEIIFPKRKWMLLYSPYLFLLSFLCITAGVFFISPLWGLAVILCECVLAVLILIKPAYLISSFMLNQFYLLVGHLGRKNILQWDRVEK